MTAAAVDPRHAHDLPGSDPPGQMAAIHAQAAEVEASLRPHLQGLVDSPRLLDPPRLRQARALLTAALQAAEALAALVPPDPAPPPLAVVAAAGPSVRRPEAPS